MSRRETCAKCRYWDPVENTDNGRGECRRLSPRWHPDAMYGGVEASWPQTIAGDWCGEYEYATQQATEKARMDIAFPGLR